MHMLVCVSAELALHVHMYSDGAYLQCQCADC